MWFNSTRFDPAVACLPGCCQIDVIASRLADNGKMSDPKSLGCQLRNARLQRNLRQTDVAKILDCDEMSVVNWELGHREPSVKFVPGILEIVGFDPRPQPSTMGDRQIAENCAKILHLWFNSTRFAGDPAVACLHTLFF